ncbi:MAG: hypothetical protein ABL983_07390 [Nitrospira sp.]
MNNNLQPRMATRVGIVIASLLIVIHIAAGFVCHTCFFDLEQPKTRSFHLHSGDDLNPCHHGRNETHPLISWACSVMQDDTAFILPDIPRLPAALLSSNLISSSFGTDGHPGAPEKLFSVISVPHGARGSKVLVHPLPVCR